MISENEMAETAGTATIGLLLINPSLDFERDQAKLRSLSIEEGTRVQQGPRLGMGYLLAIAKRNGLQAKYIDMVAYGVSIEQLLQYINQSKPVLIGLTAFTIQIKAAGFIAQEIRKHFPDALICVGGAHVTVMPKETLQEYQAFDFVVCGEGELVLLEIFESIKRGATLSNIKGVVTTEKTDYSYNAIMNLDELPFPAWEEFDLSKFPGESPHRTTLELPVSTSRGCPFSCVFCVRPFGRHRRKRTTASIIREIERNINDFGCEAICFTDETFIVDLEESKELFRGMVKEGIHRKIKWSCESRVDNASPELFRLMKEAGCYYVFFGLESGDDGVLKNAKKGFAVSQIRRAVQWAKDAGLVCAGSFILGLPGETEESANKSIRLARELNIYSTTFPIAVPFPGTELRQMATDSQYGLRILSNNWDDYGKQYPGVMDSEQLAIDKLRPLQEKAYQCNPKKKIQDFEM